MNIFYRTFPIILTFAIGLLLNSILFAELVWEPGVGFYGKGGLAEKFFPQKIKANSAVEYMELARKEEQAGNLDEALYLYREVARRYPESMYAPQALERRAIIYKNEGYVVKSFNTLEEIIQHYPEYEDFDRVIKEQYTVSKAIQDGARFRMFFDLLPGFSHPDRAIEYYETIVHTAPYSQFAPEALMNIATLAHKKKEWDIAIDALDRLISSYPEDPLLPAGYLKLAQVYASQVRGASYDQGSTREAISTYEDILILYPESEQVPSAEEGLAKMKDVYAKSKLEIGDFYWLKRNNAKAASVLYNEAITIAPNSPSADKARERLAKIDSGALPPKSIGDIIMGRYARPTDQVLEEEAQIEALESAEFFREDPLDQNYGDDTYIVPGTRRGDEAEDDYSILHELREEVERINPFDTEE